MLRSLVLTGSTLRPRSRAEKARIARELRVHVWPLVAARRLEPLIHATLPLKHAARAHHVSPYSRRRPTPRGHVQAERRAGRRSWSRAR
jgi:NADPH:quinone reductase-like Zn-dependent oxidoreductase